MRISSVRAAVVGVAVVALSSLLISTAPSAGATTVTFTIAAGGLTITNPTNLSLGNGVPGGTVTGPLGAVTVTDQRAALVATWTATVSTTTFVTGGATATETVPKANISYWSGASTATSGLGVFTPGQLTSLLAASLGGANATAFALTAGSGNNSATWNPTLIIAVPASAVVGTYTGTITHSVA